MPIWSLNQERIFEALQTPSFGNICVKAVAGSGKTTTIAEGIKRLAPDLPITAIAFNRTIAEELKARLPSYIKVTTFHALGLAALSRSLVIRPQVEQYKVRRTAQKLISQNDHEHYLTYVCKLVSLAKSFGVIHFAPNVPETYQALAEHFSLIPNSIKASEPIAWQYCIKVLEASNRNIEEIDYDDMLYLTLLRGVRLPHPSWIFVDEAQDLNAVQHALLARMLSPQARFCAVGDPQQAIYGFRGAQTNSMQLLAETFKASWLDLDVSYRCSKAVVAAAQEFCPSIKAFDLKIGRAHV